MNKFLRILLILTIFLFPIFSFNFGSGNDLFSRYLFLLLFTATAIFLFIIEALKKNERIFFSLLHNLFFLFIFWGFLSSFFASDFYNSIFGFLGENLKSFLGIGAFILLSFLIVQVFNKEFVKIFIPFFTVSYFIFAALAVIIYQFNIKLPFISLSYSSTQIGIYLVIGFFFILWLLDKSSLLNKIFSIFLSIFIFYLLLGFNSQLLWMLFGLGAFISFLIYQFYVPKNQTFQLNLNLIIFALALFFIISQINFGFILKFPQDIVLTQETSLAITVQALKEKPIFGWGFNNFDIAYNKFKPGYLNFNNLWAVSFLLPTTFYEEIFISLGVIGGLIFFAALFYLVFCLFREFKKDIEFAPLFISCVLLIFAGFIAPFSSLMFYLIFLLVAFAGLSLKYEKSASNNINTTSKLNFLNYEIAGILVGIVFFVIILALVIRFFVASYYFSLASFAQEENAKIFFAEQAIAFNPYNPLYSQQYSTYLFNLANQKIFSQTQDTAGNDILKLVTVALQNAQNLALKYPQRPEFKAFLANLYLEARIYADKPEEFLKLAKENIEKAISMASKQVQYKKILGDIYYHQALLLEEDSQYQEKTNLLNLAKAQYEEAKSSAPQFHQAYFGLAQIYEQLKDNQKAIQNYIVALQLDGLNIDYKFNLARMYYNEAIKNYNFIETEQWQLAKSYLEDILKVAPNYSNALYTIALIFEKEGDIVKAKENLEKLLSQLPEGKQKQEIQDKLDSL